jgi:hypothetical protein
MHALEKYAPVEVVGVGEVALGVAHESCDLGTIWMMADDLHAEHDPGPHVVELRVTD